MLHRLDELPDEPSFGGKARGLARMLRAGLPVPPGFVLPAQAFPLAADTLERLWMEARRLDEPLVVRSSATVEDTSHAAAPGVFSSMPGITRARLPEAIEAVRASLGTETARAYLDARGLHGADMAVVVQRQVHAVVRGTMYSRAPGDPDRVRIETASDRSDASVEVARARPATAAAARVLGLPEPIVTELLAHAERGESLLGGEPADIEWVWDGAQLWLVQLRTAPGVASARAHAEFTLAEPGGWTWDAVHNPFPLSPAQEGLVAFVDERRLAPYRQRVVHGHLFVSASDPDARAEAVDATTLRRTYDVEHVPILQAAAARIAAARDLDEALEAYATLYEVYSMRLAPLLSATRGALLEALAADRAFGEAERLVERLTSAPSVLAVLLHAVRARSITEDALRTEAAPFAPEWDVACPTFGEDPSPLVAALRAPARAARGPGAHREHELPPTLRTSRMRTLVAAAREAARIGEDDDVWFARAQAGVRRQILLLGARLGLGDALFWLPLADIRAGRLDEAGRRAAEARDRDAWRRTLRVPVRIVDGQPQYAAAGGDSGVLRGRGTGGRARGTVVRDAAEVSRTPNAVFVTPALLPSHAPAVLAAMAVVAEHGGLLGHGAALAREQGIPCVVGAPGAADLPAGLPVLVDGDAGLVVALRA